MALEYSMLPQLISGLEIGIDQIAYYNNNPDSLYYLGYYSLSALQTIATALGDGFYAENIELENNLTPVRFYLTSQIGTTIGGIKAGSTIPVLRNQNYGNLGLFFLSAVHSSSNSDDAFYKGCALNVIDISSETMLFSASYRMGYHGPVGDNQCMYIVNASSKAKVLSIGTDIQRTIGTIILCEDCIIMHAEPNSGNQTVYCITNDCQVHSTIFYGTFLTKTMISLVPFYIEDLPAKKFDGIYVADRITTLKIQCNFIKAGKMYYMPTLLGTDATQNKGLALVISDEVQESPTPYDVDPQILTNLAMTDNTWIDAYGDTYIASASSELDSPRKAYKAFDGTDNAGGYDCWHPRAGEPQWLMLELPRPTRITAFSIRNRISDTSCPRDMIFQGSNDGVTFVDIKSFEFSGVNTANVVKTIFTDNMSSYRYYRWYESTVWSYGVIAKIFDIRGYVEVTQ